MLVVLFNSLNSIHRTGAMIDRFGRFLLRFLFLFLQDGLDLAGKLILEGLCRQLAEHEVCDG